MNHSMTQALPTIEERIVAPRLLHRYFERQVKLRPQHPAIECEGETLTYAELDVQANRVAAILRSRGIGRGSLVAIYLSKSCRLFAGLLGVLKAGAGYVPLDKKFPPARIEAILADSGAAAVLTEHELADVFAFSTTAAILRLDCELAAEIEVPREPAVVKPNDVCYVIYTSGSTGKPKGVVIEHRNAVNFVRAMQRVYGVNETDRIYQGFSTAFDASIEEIWAALSLGGTLVVPREDIARSTLDAAEFIHSRNVTMFSTVPSFLGMIDHDLPTVKLLILGGEACPPELVTRWAKPGRRMLNTYGPTEATVVATAAECVAGEPVSIGGPLPGYTAYVFDAQLRPASPGEIGELYIGGDSVARGYLNRPELTAERFIMKPMPDGQVERLYRTCDLVRLGEDGRLQFVGRADGQVKIRGFRIELSEIEAVLMEHPAIRVAATKVVDCGGINDIAAYAVLKPGQSDVDRGEVAELLRRRVPEYMVPKYFDVLDELPAMPSGKVDRVTLPPPRTLFMATDRPVVLPATALEHVVVEVWQRAFHISQVSVDDDFFDDLHGHSMIAAKVVTDLRAAVETRRVGVRDLYQHRTARLLARHLESLRVARAVQEEAPKFADEQTRANPAMAPLPASRWLCVALQFAGLIAFYGVVSAPVVFAIDLVMGVLRGGLELGEAAQRATLLGFAIWPTWLLLSIAIKWIVIGRYKAGRHPVWGLYYFRWWLVSRFQSLSWSGMFVGTPLMSLYYRAMGAKVGRNCTIGTPLCTAFDLITIGEGSSIGTDTQILGYRVEDGWLILGHVTIGRECFIGMHSCLGLNVTMDDRSQLDDMSLLADHERVASGEGRRGSPAEVADLQLPAARPSRPRVGQRMLFGLIHLGLIYAMGYVLIASALPAVAMVGSGFYLGGPAWGMAMALVAAPVCVLWYLLLVVAVKRIAIGRIAPGRYPLHSAAYLRYWFTNYLMDNTRHIVLSLYATMFLPRFLRLLGAKIGRHVEISTIMRAMPDLLEIDEGSFLADACIVGGCRVHNGVFELRPNRIGERTFVGNSALVPGGIELGGNGLIGVMSTPPAGVARTPHGTRWLGSPGFLLPATEKVTCFSDCETFEPSYRTVLSRALVELLRVFLPCLVTMAIFVLFCSMVVACLELMPLWAAAIGAAVIASSLSAVSLLSVAYLKAGFIGRFEPTVKPLWCSYVWVNEVVNGLYEAVAAPALTPLMGTLFIAPLLRLMGCKIGKWVFLESTLFSEFDLVEIGDRAALNLGCTIQTHLFEDRIMKADRIRVGDECSIGNMAVVLYGTEMHRGSSLGPFSVLMKGEALPPFTRWRGIPTEPVEADPPRRESKHKREPFVARASWRVRGRFSGSELFVSHDGALNYRPRGRAAHTSGTNARRERRRAHRRFSRSETPSSGLRHEPQGLRQRHRSEGT